MKQRWRKALREWAFDGGRYNVAGVCPFWYWHCRHSWAFGAHFPSGRYFRFGNNCHGDETRDGVGVELTLTIKRPGKEHKGGPNGTSGGDRGNAGQATTRAR
jgi:hypothetical protein